MGLVPIVADFGTADYVGDVCREGFQDCLAILVGVEPEVVSTATDPNQLDAQAGRPGPLLEQLIEALGKVYGHVRHRS